MNALSILAVFAVAFLNIEAKTNPYRDCKNPSSCCGPKPSYIQLPLSYSAVPYAQRPSFPPTALLPSSIPKKPRAPTPPASPQKIYFQNLAYSAPFPSPYPAPCAPPPLSYPAPYSPLPISSPSSFTPQSSYLPQSFETASFDPSPLANFNSIKSSTPSCDLAPQYNALPQPSPSCKFQPLPAPKFIPVKLKPFPNFKAPSCGTASLSSSCQPGFDLNPSFGT